MGENFHLAARAKYIRHLPTARGSRRLLFLVCQDDRVSLRVPKLSRERFEAADFSLALFSCGACEGKWTFYGGCHQGTWQQKR